MGTTGFAKLGRTLREGDALLNFVSNDSSRILSKIQEHVGEAMWLGSLYTDDGPDPEDLGKIKLRLRGTLTEVSAECSLELEPQHDPESSYEDSETEHRPTDKSAPPGFKAK